MSKQPPISPPRWADRLLGWYCNQSVQEQVQGDAHELFYWRLEEKGPSQAKKAFLWDVVRLFKWSNIKRKTQNQQLNNIAMFKNYVKIGLRNLWKQKMPSFINIVGLSLAIGCCIVSFKWIESQYITDTFHEKADDIYLVTPTQRLENGDNQRYGQVTLDIADLIQTELVGLENVVRFRDAGVDIKVGDKRFNHYAVYMDPNFFEVFTFKTIHGDVADFKRPRTIVVNESNANAYFGDRHPIGQQIEIDVNGELLGFEVVAVIEDEREDSSIRPGLSIGFEYFEKNKDRSSTKVNTFIELNSSVSRATLEAPLAKLAAVKTELSPDSGYEAITLEPLTSMSAKNGKEIYGALGGSPPMAPVIVLSLIGAFLLLLSTFNYVNIATVMAMNRVKEIGVRKVIGSRRGHLISQFLTENLILCTLSIILGCLLASAFFLPGFNGIAGNNLTLDLLHHRNMWYFLGGLLIFITLASGAYPAFYISSFKPVAIFRGNSAKGSKRRLTGALLTFQMTLAVLTIVAGMMFVRTNTKNASRDWGYDQYDKLVTSIPGGQSLETVKAELNKNSNVVSVAASKGVLGRIYSQKKISKGEREIYSSVIGSDYKYPEMMGLKLISGDFFKKETMSQNQRSLIVNETFLTAFGMEGKDLDIVTMDSVNYSITAVVEDFHFSNFSEVIRPLAFRAMPDSMLGNITVKVIPGTILESKEAIKEIYKELNPDVNHYMFAQDSVFDGHFEEAKGITYIMIFTASLSVLLAAMGLFGLVTLSISSRIKDFGIKKVLGASMLELSKDVYKRFAVILALAIVLGSTVSVLVIGKLLDSVYGYHDPVGPIPLVLSGLLLLAIAGITINTQVFQVRKMNPANVLRSE